MFRQRQTRVHTEEPVMRPGAPRGLAGQQGDGPVPLFPAQEVVVFYYYSGHGVPAGPARERVRWLGDVSHGNGSIGLQDVQEGDGGTYTCEIRVSGHSSIFKNRTALHVVPAARRRMCPCPTASLALATCPLVLCPCDVCSAPPLGLPQTRGRGATALVTRDGDQSRGWGQGGRGGLRRAPSPGTVERAWAAAPQTPACWLSPRPQVALRDGRDRPHPSGVPGQLPAPGLHAGKGLRPARGGQLPRRGPRPPWRSWTDALQLCVCASPQAPGLW